MDSIRVNQVSNPAPKLRIHLLGDFRLVYGEAQVNQIKSPRLQALLAYLVLHRQAPQPRQYLAFLMWPDSSEAQARTNLRQLVHSLKQALPNAGEFIQSGSQTLQWLPDAPFRLDVAEFEALLAQADAAEQQGDLPALRAVLEKAVDNYHGDLLPSCYDDWILPERERLRRAFTRALERLVGLLESQNDPRGAIASAERLLRHDPLSEDTYRLLMRLHAASGDRAGALRVYHTCATVFQGELGVEPSSVTHEAYEQLLKENQQTRPIRPPQPLNTNLPIPLTSFIGREAEMAEIKRLLQATRLMTLTGPGGCGKTRLALEAALNRLDQYPDGVWWIDLAGLSDEKLLPQSVAAALGVHDQSGRPLLEILVDYLRSKQLLLLLDNCEHLVEVCAQLAEQLLSACPHLQILGTSREALSVGGETTYLVPPLNLPDVQIPSTVEELSRFEAIHLFVDRAATVLPTFRLTTANGAWVVQICRRLDGIPLAIELAAARVKVLPVEQIAARLDDVFHLLTAGRRSALLRHQTLRAAMDWSYDLLSDQERLLFRRLAVFAGGFTLEAAEAVCGGEGLEAGEVLDVLSHLVDKSLVAVTQDGAARYRLLEIIRQYASEKFCNSSEADTVNARHADFFLDFAEAAAPKLTKPEQVNWLNVLEAELGNLRAALAWTSASETRVATGLRLAEALGWFWWIRGYVGEGRMWLSALLGQNAELPKEIYAMGVAEAADIAIIERDYEAAAPLVQTSLRLYRELGNQIGLANSLRNLAILTERHDKSAATKILTESLALSRQEGLRHGTAITLQLLADFACSEGEYKRAEGLYLESIKISREIGNRFGVLWSLKGLANIAMVLRDYPQAGELFGECLVLARELKSNENIVRALVNLGECERIQGHYQQAEEYFDAGIVLLQEVGDKRTTYVVKMNLGAVHLALGKHLAAKGLLIECMNVFQAMQDVGPITILTCLMEFAGCACAEEEFERALRLLSAIHESCAATGDVLDPANRADYDRYLSAARLALSRQQFEIAWTEGQAMTLKQAIADALSLAAE